ncbi:MAG: hypothetical protein WCG66_04350 [bacterium]
MKAQETRMEKNLTLLMILLLGFFPAAAALAQTKPPPKSRELIDYFLPMPIRSELSKDVWGAKEVGPRDPGNGLEDSTLKKWCYWDEQILKGAEGKYHLFSCRWDEPESSRFNHNRAQRDRALKAAPEG